MQIDLNDSAQLARIGIGKQNEVEATLAMLDHPDPAHRPTPEALVKLTLQTNALILILLSSLHIGRAQAMQSQRRVDPARLVVPGRP